VLNRFLGNVGATWRHRLAAGAALPPSRPVQRHTYLTSGAVTASTESLPLTALLFQNEVVNNAASLPAGPRAEAALTRARMLARLGRTADAERDLDLAEQLLAATCLEGNDPTIQRSNDPTIQGKSIDGREGLQQATVLAFHPVVRSASLGSLERWAVGSLHARLSRRSSHRSCSPFTRPSGLVPHWASLQIVKSNGGNVNG
jgi:hypothetical protein